MSSDPMKPGGTYENLDRRIANGERGARIGGYVFVGACLALSFLCGGLVWWVLERLVLGG